MGSSKRKKGQQRKAAKKDRVPKGNEIFIQQNDGRMIVHPENKKYILQLVQNGNAPTTQGLLAYDIPAADFSLKDSGVLSVVLVFLKRCEDESFNNLVNTNRSGTLQSPSHWINLLQKATLQKPSCRLQIAENIGPLVKCMCIMI